MSKYIFKHKTTNHILLSDDWTNNPPEGYLVGAFIPENQLTACSGSFIDVPDIETAESLLLEKPHTFCTFKPPKSKWQNLVSLFGL